jgi:hypothetical protein
VQRLKEPPDALGARCSNLRSYDDLIWSASFPTGVKDVGSAPFSMTKEDIDLTTNPRAPACRLFSSMVLRPPHRHIGLPSGYAPQMMPHPPFIENGTDPGGCGAVCQALSLCPCLQGSGCHPCAHGSMLGQSESRRSCQDPHRRMKGGHAACLCGL